MSEFSSSKIKINLVTQALVRHRATLRSYVRVRTKASRVDDVLQIAALRAIEAADSLHDSAKILPWLYRIHRNIIIDSARAQAREERMLSKFAGSQSEPSPVAADLTNRCDCSVHLSQSLTSNYADILKLVDLGESTIQEAALKLGITANNAMVRLHRARKALRKKLEKHCGVLNARDCADCRCIHDGCCSA